MGKIVEKKTKKKGRPSLLDLQKRQLKLLNNNHNNNLLNPKNNISNNNNHNNININIDTRNSIQLRLNSSSGRSTRRNSNPNPNSGGNLSDEGEGEGDGDGLEGENGGRKRKIESISSRSGGVVVPIDDSLQVEKQSSGVTNQINNEQGSDKHDDGPLSTPLPDKKLLVFIIDSLQKKDTYGVFAEPVDPEELPDYHEIIKHPMDFSTLRKKLEDGAYGNLENFEKDIFLICSNAMQYNSPDSIYFRQARSMQELARKNFDNLRQDSDDDDDEVELERPEPKVARRGRPPKNLKRPPGRPPLERSYSDFPDSKPSTAGGSTTRVNEHKKGPSHLEKYGSTGSFARNFSGPRNGEMYVEYAAKRSERFDDLIGSTSKGYSTKHWKKQVVVDEGKRNTYQNSSRLACEPSVLNTFQMERKQLIAIGIHTEYGYARSLARFAAKLGPVAWKVASKRIQRCLPAGTKFGQGWVGENEAPSERLPQQSHDTCGPSTTPHALIQSNDDTSARTEPSSEMDLPTHHPQTNNESNNETSTPEACMDSDSGPINANGGPHQKFGLGPPDLNVGFQSLGSGSTTASVQPELALQL